MQKNKIMSVVNIKTNISLVILTIMVLVSCNSTKTVKTDSSDKILVSTNNVLKMPKSVALIVKEKGTLLFEDDFNRTETDTTKEQVGNAWKTNSKQRAQGVKQADLDNGVLKVTRVEEANHQTSILHDLPINNAVVQVKFKIFDEKGVAFNFNDPKAKKVAKSGHICQVIVRSNQVIIRDQKMGNFNIELREKKASGNYTKEQIKALLKEREAIFKRETSLNEWHLINIVIVDDVFETYIDGEKVGELKSSGINHPVKQNMALSIPLKGYFDDVKIWSLDF